ncbi:MAG: transcription-repair coupling factor [Actinomycetota bacterium]|nr:transcription-repair coupling factor [Actinomycetota bacterium]
MSLRSLPPLLRDEPAMLQVLGRASAVLAVPEPARAFALAGLATNMSRRPILVATPSGTDAERVANDLATFLGDDAVELFKAWETLPFERVSPSIETVGVRLRTLWRLRDPERVPAVVVAPVRALLQRLGPHVDEIEPVTIAPGDVIDPTELVTHLVEQGYRREYQVESRGEVAVRGSIVDVFPSTGDHPVRIDLWGDEVERLTAFSVSDQRSTDELARVEIFGCRELLATPDVRERAEALVASEPWGREQWERIAGGELFDGMESWLPWLAPSERLLPDLLGADGLVVLVEPRRMRDRAADLIAEEEDLAATLAKTWGAVHDDAPADGDTADGAVAEAEARHKEFPRLHLDFDRLLSGSGAATWSMTVAPEGPDVATITATGWDPMSSEGPGLMTQLDRLLRDGFRVVLGADAAGSGQRLADLLSDRGIDLRVDPDATSDLTVPGGAVCVAPLERGFVLPEIKLAVLAERDVTGRRRAHRTPRPRRRDAQRFFEDLQPGDHVVHHHHGVGRYTGMVKRAIGGNERDYLLLEYKGGDKLYIPSEQIDAIRPYTGGESPTLNRLGGAEFQRTKSKVRSAIAEIAQELVVLYQRRVNTAGHTFDPDSPWQTEVEDAFPYQLTPDQASAVDAVKGDMESDHPMDRLVCGDVGFGKTEIAVRAAFKAIQSGHQVAILVPTTLLAQQHFSTFSDRYAGFPVRVEVLSRFLTPGQARKVMADIESGEVDCVIGTHRLLSDDVRFKRLGLLVVDEEQRFGVSHKEQIKQLKADVDVLTLTATPIPRTLEMSLTGIRDLSLLNTPPADRQPILTYVGEYDERAVAESIRRELLREGQVFYVHNRVRDIEDAAARIRELVPEARVAIAHGQMDEGSLEQVVLDFWEGAYDVLVCTTIIESGIDMPTVNTLVVERADLLGLGQLHQLRGRVGRAGSRAYAYLFFPPDRVLSEEAYERLRTIGEATELGSGFRIAMRDLEIRGAGNLLGTGQSGHIAAVGYDLYCQMVTEAVAELKGEPIPEPVEVTIDLPVDAVLPADYVEREEQRLEAYRRLSAVTSQSEVDDIRAEWEDRYGPVPSPAEALLGAARLRAECVRVGVTEVVVTKGQAFSGPKYVARLTPLPLKTSQAIRLQRLFKNAHYKEDVAQVQIPLRAAASSADDLIEFLRTMVPEAGSEPDAPSGRGSSGGERARRSPDRKRPTRKA